jgi:antitoxin (DNA-binding transcriptional repressor) of toxin-antitoxin stability system
VDGGRTTVVVDVADADLADLLARVARGEEVVLADQTVPVARLARAGGEPADRRVFGAMAGRARVGPEFFDPLPEDELRAWEGRR